jgi:hypothetical protein
MSEPTYKYAPYDVLLCRIDEDCNQELHPNGQPKLFSYSSDPVNDLFNEACYEINECEERGEYRNWIQPIPMGQKPINRAKLIELLRQAEVALSSAMHSCDSYDQQKDLRDVEGYLCQAIEEVDTDA